ncbi:MAG: site-2 protease family protein, partial [Parcubacteria group bacterium]
MVTVLIFIAVLAVIVLVHEFGHFAVARKLGVAVEEFGVGFPPRIAAVKSKKTAYSLNLIPIGGFVKIKGEQGDHPDDSDSFGYQKIWRRALIIVAG